MSDVPKISLIIPTLNPIAFDNEFLEYASTLCKSGAEIIIIDSQSDSDKIQSHRALANQFISIPRHKFDHGGTRNIAARHARGDYLVFMTQDAIPVSPESIPLLVNPLKENPKIAVSFGRQLPRPDANTIERFVRSFNYPNSSILKNYEAGRASLKTFFSSNVFSCYRKSAFWEVGGFPEKIILNEDMIINAKLMLKGYLTRYTAEASVWHSHNYSLLTQFKRYFDIGVSIESNQSILPSLGQAGDGRALVRGLLGYLLRSKNFHLLPRALGDLSARATGFFLGRKHSKLPLALKRRLSLHPGYWKIQES